MGSQFSSLIINKIIHEYANISQHRRKGSIYVSIRVRYQCCQSIGDNPPETGYNDPYKHYRRGSDPAVFVPVAMATSG